jgi:hypothetical protein
MLERVDEAVRQIQEAFPDCTVTARDDGDGGAQVMVSDVPLGPPFVQATTWVAFAITRQYPYADVYPHFVRGDLQRADGAGLGAGMGLTAYLGQPAIQLSRRSSRLNPATDTAVLKLQKVLHWLLTRP